jgi:hypothetical protein
MLEEDMNYPRAWRKQKVTWKSGRFVDDEDEPVRVPFGTHLLEEGTNFIWILRKGPVKTAKQIEASDKFLEELEEDDYFIVWSLPNQPLSHP